MQHSVPNTKSKQQCMFDPWCKYTHHLPIKKRKYNNDHLANSHQSPLWEDALLTDIHAAEFHRSDLWIHAMHEVKLGDPETRQVYWAHNNPWKPNGAEVPAERKHELSCRIFLSNRHLVKRALFTFFRGTGIIIIRHRGLEETFAFAPLFFVFGERMSFRAYNIAENLHWQRTHMKPGFMGLRNNPAKIFHQRLGLTYRTLCQSWPCMNSCSSLPRWWMLTCDWHEHSEQEDKTGVQEGRLQWGPSKRLPQGLTKVS